MDSDTLDYTHSDIQWFFFSFKGDSGGGLVCAQNGKYTVYGISSFTGHLCAVEMRPAVFTKVDRYLHWIGLIIQQEQQR